MVENVVGKLVQGLLMPKVAPAWYAGTRRLTEFPEASAESLLLLGFVTLEVSDLEAQESSQKLSNRQSNQMHLLYI